MSLYYTTIAYTKNLHNSDQLPVDIEIVVYARKKFMDKNKIKTQLFKRCDKRQNKKLRIIITTACDNFINYTLICLFKSNLDKTRHY